MTAPAPPRPPQEQPKQKLPAGLKMSNVWRGPDGSLIEGESEVPVDKDWQIAGRLWVCPVSECVAAVWVFSLDPDVDPDPSCCTRHPTKLVPAALNLADRDPVAGARTWVAQRLRGIYEQRRDKAVAAAKARAAAAQQAATEAARRTAADMRGHVPSLAASAVALGGGAAVVEMTGPALATFAGLALASVGAVAAYIAVYVVERVRAKLSGVDFVGRRAKKARAHARHIATGTLATGAWTAAAAVVGMDSATAYQGPLMLAVGLVLAWVVNRSHWDELWSTRRRLRDLARQKAEEAARRAVEEAQRIAQEPAVPVPPAAVVIDENDPLAVGARMAEEWARIALLPSAPSWVARTRIVVPETEAITAPLDGELVTIGWQFAIESEPGALVPKPGIPAPLIGGRDWILAVLDNGRHDPSSLSVVDRPGGRANRGLLLIADRAPLGDPVRWKGRDGVRMGADGSLYAHRGRSLLGEDIEETLYIPGQPFGSLTVGNTGSGKTGGTILKLLNWLAAGIFPILFDPKQLVDYGDFVGVFPIGVTQEHRDVILQSLVAERKRRERHMGRRPILDEFGREVHGESQWDLADGPPIGTIWEEFHDLIWDDGFIALLTNHLRFERAAAMGESLVTQGGGLADLKNSMLRALVSKVALTTYRSDDRQARLAGSRNTTYSAADLPPLAGMCLVEAPNAPAVPLRTAYVPRTLNHPDSVFNQLYGRTREKVLLLPPPALPLETVEVFERQGLMDLWRRAQGPGGLDRLLADAENAEIGLAPTTPALASPTGLASSATAATLQAADVVLAILLAAGGECRRSVIDNHGMWLTTPGWGKPPKASTISRAAKPLENNGLVKRGDGSWALTEKGKERAKAIAAQLAQPAQAATAPTAAEIEHQAELADEERDPDRV